MDSADNLIALGQQARMIQNITTHKVARKLAGQAVQCATAGLMSHQDGNLDAANLHASNAANYLTDAAKLHLTTLGEETPSAQVLDVAHLGAAHQMHQDYVDAINEGKHNGR